MFNKQEVTYRFLSHPEVSITDKQMIRMKNNLDKFSIEAECPIRNVIDRISHKWSLLVLLLLDEVETLRFNEIHKTIGSISQKMLTVTLKSLEADGFVTRTMFPQIPPRVEYKLTERAKDVLPHIHNLVKWSKDNMHAIEESRSNYRN